MPARQYLRDVTTAQLGVCARDTPGPFRFYAYRAMLCRSTDRAVAVALHDRDLWLDEIPPVRSLCRRRW